MQSKTAGVATTVMGRLGCLLKSICLTITCIGMLQRATATESRIYQTMQALVPLLVIKGRAEHSLHSWHGAIEGVAILVTLGCPGKIT